MSEYLSLRVNKNLKDDFNAVCKKRGYTPSRAVRLFCINYIKDKKAPYPDMLNRIRKYSDEDLERVGFRIVKAVRSDFQAICKENGEDKMSNVIRAFMDYCATNDCLPFK